MTNFSLSCWKCFDNFQKNWSRIQNSKVIKLHTNKDTSENMYFIVWLLVYACNTDIKMIEWKNAQFCSILLSRWDCQVCPNMPTLLVWWKTRKAYNLTQKGKVCFQNITARAGLPLNNGSINFMKSFLKFYIQRLQEICSI